MSTYHLKDFMLAVAIECSPFYCLAFFSAPVANRFLSLMCHSQLTTLMRIGKADDQGPELRGTARSIDICTHLQISNASLRVADNDVLLLATCWRIVSLPRQGRSRDPDLVGKIISEDYVRARNLPEGPE